MSLRNTFMAQQTLAQRNITGTSTVHIKNTQQSSSSSSSSSCTLMKPLWEWTPPPAWMKHSELLKAFRSFEYGCWCKRIGPVGATLWKGFTQLLPSLLNRHLSRPYSANRIISGHRGSGSNEDDVQEVRQSIWSVFCELSSAMWRDVHSHTCGDLGNIWLNATPTEEEVKLHFCNFGNHWETTCGWSVGYGSNFSHRVSSRLKMENLSGSTEEGGKKTGCNVKFEQPSKTAELFKTAPLPKTKPHRTHNASSIRAVLCAHTHGSRVSL